MCPVQIWYYLCWWILSGHLLITAPSASLGQYQAKPFELGKGLIQHLGPTLSNRSRSSYIFGLQESKFGSLKNDLVSCEDLEGVGSFDTNCQLKSNLYVNSNVYVVGKGNLEIRSHVSIVCLIEGCTISFNLSGSIEVGQNAAIVAGSVVVSALSLSMGPNSSINTTALGGPPPSQTSGTPVGYDGAGGGHGGRGASCLKITDSDFWGGDVYCWSTLSRPWCYGSKGGSTSDNHKLGGNGGGRVFLDVRDLLYINGSVTAKGGDGGTEGGGGSGGSIMIHAPKLLVTLSLCFPYSYC